MLASLSWWVIGCAPIDVDLGVQNHYIHPRHRKSTVSHYSLKIYVIQYLSQTRYRGAFPQFRDERADRGENQEKSRNRGVLVITWGRAPETRCAFFSQQPPWMRVARTWALLPL